MAPSSGPKSTSGPRWWAPASRIEPAGEPSIHASCLISASVGTSVRDCDAHNSIQYLATILTAWWCTVAPLSAALSAPRQGTVVQARALEDHQASVRTTRHV